jgi:hypothetical protein
VNYRLSLSPTPSLSFSNSFFGKGSSRRNKKMNDSSPFNTE